MYEKMYVIVLILLVFAFLYLYNQKVEIIYFYNQGCLVSNETDVLIEKIQDDLGDKVKMTRIDLFNPKINETKLVERFGVKGVPTIVINGKIYPYEYNYTIFKREVCRNFVFKPEKC
jgi:hypothetical protein